MPRHSSLLTNHDGSELRHFEKSVLAFDSHARVVTRTAFVIMVAALALWVAREFSGGPDLGRSARRLHLVDLYRVRDAVVWRPSSGAGFPDAHAPDRSRSPDAGRIDKLERASE
jgi:hypothetical protein